MLISQVLHSEWVMRVYVVDTLPWLGIILLNMMGEEYILVDTVASCSKFILDKNYISVNPLSRLLVKSARFFFKV